MDIRQNLHRFLKKLHLQTGFTLIELIVVIAMLGILLVSLIVTFNPLEQYNRANDGKREHDLGQIQRALDAYFNDKGCYPTSLPFGSKWSAGSQVFMEQVPQDPSCAMNPNKCYAYETDSTNTCPQWSVLYSALRSSAIPANACPLAIRTACIPSNYTSSGFNYCLVSGDIDCSAVTSFVIPTPTGIGGGGGGGGGGATATPTPTPTPAFNCGGSNQFFGCTGDNRCNSISPGTQCTQNGGSVFCYCDTHCNQSCQFN